MPAIRVENIEIELASPDRGVDIIAHITVGDKPRILVCEVKPSGQPRHVRAGLLQLRDSRRASRQERYSDLHCAVPVTRSASSLQREQCGVSYLVGNARLVFDNVFIEKLVSSAPPAERRELKSLFKPKSAQMQRTLLRDPKRAWRVVELAKSAGVSLGHVSNVRAALLSREWGQESDSMVSSYRSPMPCSTRGAMSTSHLRASVWASTRSCTAVLLRPLPARRLVQARRKGRPLLLLFRRPTG